MDADTAYAGLLRELIEYGEPVRTRNADVRRLFVRVLTFGRTPLVSLRRTAWRNALREWEWFLSGSDRLDDLHPAVRPWWRPWADAAGRVKNTYSVQLRHSAGRDGEVDQVAALVAGLRDHPFSRRHVVTTWHAADMLDPGTPITTCHGTVIQCAVGGGRLDLATYQRSADVMVGLPHNWVQYWAFLLWLAARAGLAPGSLAWVGGDVHLYEAHLPLARRVATATPPPGPPPALVYRPTSDDFRADDFGLDREYRPAIGERAEMVV